MAGHFEVDEQSVVEFQLGNKQLLLLFVGLLVICAIFFFIGLRVGEDTARSKSAQMIVDEPGGQEELAENSSPAAKPKDAGAMRLQTNVIRPTARKQESKRVTAKPVSGNEEVRKTAASSPTAENPPATVKPSGRFYLQVASPQDEAAAKRLRAQLAARYPTIIQPVVVNGRQHYRVRVGPFQSKAKALEFKNSLGPKYKDAIVAKI